MPNRAAHCTQREAVSALARAELVAEQASQVEKHLERCGTCRAAYRQETGERFPRFPNYTILQEIGRGGFGVVYKAVHHAKERIEAIKVLYRETSQRSAYFENEVHLAARLSHPNIATLYEAHLRKHPAYYAMEYVPGEQLDEYVQHHGVSLEDRIRIFKQIADALEYAHQQGVVHRDLKPQNILVDGEGRPRILDFGIGKRVELGEDELSGGSPGQRAEGVLGTFGFIAPEQLAGKPVDSRADIYALGALLFYLVTGQPARFAQQSNRLVELLRERQVSRAEDLAAIIDCCVQPAPEARYATCADLAKDVESYLAGHSVQARPHASPVYRLKRISALVLRNYPIPVHALAATSVALLLALVFWAGGVHRAPGVAVAAGQHVALVGVMPSTVEALHRGSLGVDLPSDFQVSNRKSWRILYGRFLEALADAQPRVVAWDYFFPDCWPEYDRYFVEGVAAVGAPVVIGCRDTDINAEPVICPAILAAVHGWGTIYTKNLDFLREELEVPLAIERGFNPPIQALSLAAFAAARHPECAGHIRSSPSALDVRYEKYAVVKGEQKWLRQTDQIPIFEVTEADPDDKYLRAGDRASLGRFPIATIAEWEDRAIAMEDVFRATPAQRREWFTGKAVLVGQMIPLPPPLPDDRHRLSTGQSVFGCQAQALMLDSLFAQVHIPRLDAPQLALRVCLWCLAATILARVLPLPGRIRLRATVPVCVLISVAGLCIVPITWTTSTAVWRMELVIAISALACAGGAALVVRLVHERQLRLTPVAIYPDGDSTAPSTLLAGASSRPGKSTLAELRTR